MSAPVGHTAMQLPQYTQAESGSGFGVFGRDAGVEAASGDRDRERVLILLAARVDALVTEDALRVVAHVQVVVDLRGRMDGGGRLAVRSLVVSGALAVALGVGRRGRPVALGMSVVPAQVLLRPRRDGEVDGGGQKLDHHLSAVTHAGGVGVDHHVRLDLARAGGDQRTRALQLDHADPTRVGGSEGVAITQRGRVDTQLFAGIQNRRAFRHFDRTTVDRYEISRAGGSTGTIGSSIMRVLLH